MSSNGSPALSNSQYSNYSDSNTSWTPGEPSEVSLGTSMTTSAIKIGVVTFFFWPSAGHPPSDPWFGILVPPPPWCSLSYCSLLFSPPSIPLSQTIKWCKSDLKSVWMSPLKDSVPSQFVFSHPSLAAHLVGGHFGLLLGSGSASRFHPTHSFLPYIVI